MKKYTIGRHINGICLNNLEYVLDGNKDPMLFDSEGDAEGFLLSNGVDEDDIQFYIFTEVKA